jgi:hypothetical protein
VKENFRVNKKYAFTLVEILIASGLLSLFILAAFSLYRSGSKNFIIGSWRAEEQKTIQTFASVLSKDLSQASSDLFSISSDGTCNSLLNTPIYINKKMYSKTNVPVFLNISENKWQCLLAFSASHPHIEASVFNAETIGSWSGVTIWGKNGKIRYQRTGAPETFSSEPTNIPASIIGFPGTPMLGAGQRFISNPDYNRTQTYDTSIEEIAVMCKGADTDKPNSLEFIIKSIRREGGKKTESEITQNILVKLASQTATIGF